MTKEEIINLLPYGPPFLFVDKLKSIDDNGATGFYTFPKDSDFYNGHFVNYPITPGVILTETMAQIGVVCLGIYLMKDKITEAAQMPQIALVFNQVDFFLPVYPGERVEVNSYKEYFRFGKLKCRVEMMNAKKEMVCKGTIAGMITEKKIVNE